jgi:hypothetical protein
MSSLLNTAEVAILAFYSAIGCVRVFSTFHVNLGMFGLRSTWSFIYVSGSLLLQSSPYCGSGLASAKAQSSR